VYGADGPDTFGLDVTNIALALVTLACVVVIVVGVVRELASRRRRHVAAADDHAFVTPGRGLTMADGGENNDEAKPTPPKGR